MSDTDFSPASNVPLAIIALATFLALVVFTAPLTTLDAMTTTLSLTPGQQAWVMSGMPLGAACGLLTAGAFGDTIGRRRTFVSGLWITALSSIAAALSPSGSILIAMRVVQGFGSAGIMACGLGLLGQIYTGEARRHAAAIWAAALGGGVAAGPILASLLLGLVSWQALHWVLAAISTLLAGLAAARLPESPASGESVDMPGSLLLMTGLACLLSALIEIRAGASGLVSFLIAVGAVLLMLFAWIEQRTANPILEIGMFRNPDFSGATLAAFASGAGVLALMSMVPTVLVRGLGEAPMHTAFVLLAWSAVTMLSALGARFLPASLSSRQRVILTLVGCAFGQLLLLGIGDGAHWAIALPGLFVAGISNGILNAALGHEAVETVPPERSAMGSAANNTARYLGSAIGIAIVSILISGAGTESIFRGWHEAVLATSIFSLAGALAMVAVHRRTSRFERSRRKFK